MSPHGELPPPPPADTTDRGPLPTAFRADIRLPASIVTFVNTNGNAISSAPSVPLLALGLRTGRVGVLGGLGFSRVTVSRSRGLGGIGQSDSSTEVSFAPTLTYDFFQSTDQKALFYGLGAAILGAVVPPNGTVSKDLGFQFAVGASYALHENFRLGLEAGPVGHVLDAGSSSTVSVVTMYAALVGSFLYPR